MAQLNVIFHGLAAFYQRAKEIIVFLPDMPAVHVYRAGNWLAETELAAGFYRLEGVTGATQPAPFEADRNLMLGKIQLSHPYQGSHAVLFLPMPHHIRALKVVIPTGFEGTDAHVVAGTKGMAMAQVLTYNCADLSACRLGQHDWCPLDPHAAFANLHVHAEEEVGELGTEEHAREAFSATIRMLGNLDVRLKPGPIDLDPNLSLNPVENLDPREADSLEERRKRLSAVGSLVREQRLALQQKNPCALNDMFSAFDRASEEVFGSKTGSCTHIVATES